VVEIFHGLGTCLPAFLQLLFLLQLLLPPPPLDTQLLW
jgi:hypothetical protein